MLADKGYDSDAIVEHVEAMGAKAVIPPKRNRKQKREYDKGLYKQRNRIERCFSKLKCFRRFATRYEKPKNPSMHSSPSHARGCISGYMPIRPSSPSLIVDEPKDALRKNILPFLNDAKTGFYLDRLQHTLRSYLPATLRT